MRLTRKRVLGKIGMLKGIGQPIAFQHSRGEFTKYSEVSDTLGW
ncbi:hypothetical protein [Pontibacter sp. G13]|nr:hypothetical protein [Pontibacter sp. G13]WNJ19466.1 hypothetical protein RJD25_03145 [Pontibacter sp. G13]